MSIAEKVIEEIKALEGKKQNAIKELLAKRQEIDQQLAMLGHQPFTGAKRGRKPGSKNKPTTSTKQSSPEGSKKSSSKKPA